MVKIFTDSGANLPAEYIAEHQISVLQLSYMVNGTAYVHEAGQPFDGKQFYDAMRNGADVKTSMVNMDAFLTAFTAALELGEDILYVGLSSGVSGTFHAAVTAAEELRESYPMRQIVVFDTFGASLGEGLFVYKAVELLEKGETLSATETALYAYRPHICQYYSVDDLKYLRNSGRIRSSTALVGNVLQMKPILTASEDGKMLMHEKVRGRKQVIVRLAEIYDTLVIDKNADIGIAHADNADGADALLMALRAKNFTGRCITVYCEPVLGSHAGPGFLALFFAGIHR